MTMRLGPKRLTTIGFTQDFRERIPMSHQFDTKWDVAGRARTPGHTGDFREAGPSGKFNGSEQSSDPKGTPEKRQHATLQNPAQLLVEGDDMFYSRRCLGALV